MEPSGERTPWLVAGLGNPGPEYEFTYHNLGFLTIGRLAERNRVRVNRTDSASLTGAGSIAGQPVVLAKPQTFMNVSGPAVRKLMLKYGIGPERLVLVYDELALPWGSLRVRPRGSAGGHHGVESVIRAAGTGEFARVRLGIHPGHPVKDGAAYVLAAIRRGQREELDSLLDLAAQAVETIIAEGVEKAMTKFNRRAQGLKTEEE